MVLALSQIKLFYFKNKVQQVALHEFRLVVTVIPNPNSCLSMYRPCHMTTSTNVV